MANEKEITPLTGMDTDVLPEGDFSLEEILAEYGGGLERQLFQEAEDTPAEKTGEPLLEESPAETPPAEEPPAQAVPTEEASAVPAEAEIPQPEPEPPAPSEAEEPGEEPEHTVESILQELADEPDPPVEIPPAVPGGPAAPKAAPPMVDVEQLNVPSAPRPVPLETVVEHTVEAVMYEQHEEAIHEQLAPPLPSRLFKRRKPMEDTEEIPLPPEPEPEPDPEPIGPEPDLWTAAMRHHKAFAVRSRTRFAALLAALPPTLLLLAEQKGLSIPLWSGDPKFQTIVLLACLSLTAVFSRHVFAKAVRMLFRGRCVCEAAISLSALVAAADCGFRLFSSARSPADPYAAVACLSLAVAQWGVSWESQGTYDMYRAAAVDSNPPYLVANTGRGACKQRGSIPGFYTTASRDDAATIWQAVLLPVFLVATFVFAGLSSFGQERKADFLLNWSAILAAAATFSMPLCWSLPWSKLSRHLQKTGCAVASWSGAQKISANRCMILTDTDLFPPGTIQLNGQKFYGEEPVKAIAYAAAMTRAAGCGLARFFEDYLKGEGGRLELAVDFSFYEEGGYAATIRGETVLLGTASFMRKMDIRLPGNLNLKTGVYLAIEHHLSAVFAVKYEPSDNVDFALKMMRRSRLTPVLASRDPNITPALLRRKFNKNIRLEYPDLTERVALSEVENDQGDLPRALLFREGLLPYAEAVAGSLRLCKAVRRAAALSLLGSWIGTLLTFYLVSLGQYELMNPLALELFLFLWTLPVLLMADWTGRY